MRSIKQLQKQAKKLKIRITKKSKYKRIYKSKKQLIKEIKMKNKKLKFGVKKISFSDNTKKDGNNITLGQKRNVSQNRKEIVKKLLTNSSLREKQAENEKKISELIASILNEYEINNIIEFIILDNLFSIYRSSRINNINYFENLKQKYYMNAPIDKKSEIIQIFSRLKPVIELIVQIRNS